MRIRGTLRITDERWPIAGSFVIAHGAKTEAHVVVARLHHEGHTGWGEATPYPRYGESVDGVMAQMESARSVLADGMTHDELSELLPPGAARAALDAAMWDLAAQTTRRPVHDLIGLPPPGAMVTAYTLSLATPSQMGMAAQRVRERALLKIKLDGDPELSVARLTAIHESAPAADLLVDANASWTRDTLQHVFPQLADLGVVLLEQPLGEDDSILAEIPHPVPVAADEACRSLEDIAAIAGRYDAVNIKVDKAGGLTGAVSWAKAAHACGMTYMVGCHVCTSLSLAPALLLGAQAQFVDLDAGLLLQKDRERGARYVGSTVAPGQLWGDPR